MKLAQEINILPLYSEYGNVWAILIDNPSSEPLSKQDVADALREYAYILETQEETKN
jgi:hypothetical protein